MSRNDETGVEVFRACDYVSDGAAKVDVCVKFCTQLSIVEDELYARKKLDSRYCIPIRDTLATSTGFVIVYPNATTLEELLAANPNGSRVEGRKAVKWFFAIAKALHNFHASGIPHTEVTAANVGVTREGRWTLLSVGSALRNARLAAEACDVDNKFHVEAAENAAAAAIKGEDGKFVLPPISPPRKNFGTVKNMSPIRYSKNDNSLAFASDISDLGKIGCRLWGVTEAEARDMTVAGKVSKKHRKAPVAMLGRCLRGEISAEDIMTDPYFISASRKLNKEKGQKVPKLTSSASWVAAASNSTEDTGTTTESDNGDGKEVLQKLAPPTGEKQQRVRGGEVVGKENEQFNPASAELNSF